MNSLTKTQKLFHAVVVLGMAATLGCSSDNAPGNDAATNEDTSTAQDSGTVKDSSTKDVLADTAPPKHDGPATVFVGWLTSATRLNGEECVVAARGR